MLLGIVLGIWWAIEGWAYMSKALLGYREAVDQASCRCSSVRWALLFQNSWRACSSIVKALLLLSI
jgi:hypothetical protein